MRLRSALVPLLLGAAAVVGACGPSGGGNGNDDGDDRGDDDGTPDGGGDDDTRPDARVRADAGPPTDPPDSMGCRKMDIVFVVDDSGSMGDEQAELGRNFPEFARVLDEYRVRSGEPLDYRVALTTTARTIRTRLGNTQIFSNHVTGDNGAFRTPDGVGRSWIQSDDAGRRDLLKDLAVVGTGGSPIEMPLDAARLALTDQIASGGTNAGFLRDDALLAIVLLTDEEDCSRLDGRTDADAITLRLIDDPETVICRSLATPQQYVDIFDDVKGGRDRWATAVIAGDGTCEGDGSGNGAEDSPRLKDFVAKTGENAIFRSICDDDFSPALKDALDTFQAACDGLPPVD
jgi:hypothetical protein